MNFSRGRHREEPEINFIPLIDVLLVILIFLMSSTTYSKFAELQINLPTADAPPKEAAKSPELEIAVTSGGQYAVDGQKLKFTTVEDLAVALRKAAKGREDPVIIINADGSASHQSVVNILQATRMAGFGKLTFATQTPQP